MNRSSRQILWFASLLALAGAVSCISKQAIETPAGDRVPALAPTTEDGITAFRFVHAVAVSPRCANCHVPGDRPVQFEGDARRVHSMNIQRQISQLGHSCQTCHQDHNGELAHQPPGAHNWSLPHFNKGYDPRISARDLCRLYKNPKANFFESGQKKDKARNAHELLEHVSTDPLIIWAWNPGPGRVPAQETHGIFVGHFKRWVEAGAPCPEN